MATHSEAPDALFVRHPVAEQEHGLPVIGLVFLLAPNGDPEAQARSFVSLLGPLHKLPQDGAVVAVWEDAASAEPADIEAKAEARERVKVAPVVMVAVVGDADVGEPEVAYLALPDDIVADARASMAEALREALH